ncbi:Uncharacterised protein [Vibrio cholerae]|nr:Uncharacterised protein [Vibrio cholerae]
MRFWWPFLHLLKGITTNLILATLKRRQKPSLPFLLKGTWWF